VDVEVERTSTFEEELPDVYVTVYLERAPTAQERAEFDRVVAAWYDLGARAGFGDAFRDGSTSITPRTTGNPWPSSEPISAKVATRHWTRSSGRSAASPKSTTCRLGASSSALEQPPDPGRARASALGNTAH
jgi:hypothetical protein